MTWAREFAAGGRGERSDNPRSPTGFRQADSALAAFLERRAARLRKAKADGTLPELLLLERLEAEADRERIQAAERRNAEARARREAQDRAAFLRRRARTPDERLADRRYMAQRLAEALRARS